MAELSKWGDNTAVVRYQTSKLQDLKEKQNGKKKKSFGQFNYCATWKAS